ncbi:hypothetical protein J1N35_041149, partial [Gossypium stocksii]
KIHLMYLPLFVDFQVTHSYNWGLSVLAMLYCELFQVTKHDTQDICGCQILLQSWALYKMPFLASLSHQQYVFPLVN